MPDGSLGPATWTTPVVYAPGSPLEHLVRSLERVGASQATVLITGETGTGKEVFARRLHELYVQGTGASGAFVPVNVGAIPENLLESELFGHVKGAFTGATSNRRGRVAMAEGGTLFLDEIAELSPTAQVKLLRLLQERKYEPVGDCRSVAANFRLVAATHRDLAKEVKEGRFREDLYYRLFVCPVHLPALRDRKMDVPELVHHFWAGLGERRPFTAAALQALSSYSWPGNVRELENLVERLSVCADGPHIGLESLPHPYRRDVDAPDTVGGGARLERAPSGAAVRLVGPRPAEEPYRHPREAVVEEAKRWTANEPARRSEVSPSPPASELDDEPTAEVPMLSRGPEPSTHDGEPVRSGPVSWPEGCLPSADGEPVPADSSFPISLPDLLKDVEWRYIEAALEQTGGNRQAAAKMLGLGRTTLVEKIKRYRAAVA